MVLPTAAFPSDPVTAGSAEKRPAGNTRHMKIINIAPFVHSSLFTAKPLTVN
jgi:hypothetical protein